VFCYQRKKERKMKDNKKEYINDFGAEHIEFIVEQFSGRTENDLDKIIDLRENEWEDNLAIIMNSLGFLTDVYDESDEMDKESRVVLKTTIEKLSRWYQFEKKQQEHRDKVKIGGSNYYQKEAN
jgi:hypothetical protein